MKNKLLISAEGRSFLVSDITKDFHSQFGMIKSAVLKKAKNGDELETNTGKKLVIISATFADEFSKIKRGPQIISRKDIGAIIAFTGINKNTFVVDAGGGSGALCCFLAGIAKKVVTYDNDDRSIEKIKENKERLGVTLTIKKGDIYEKLPEKNVDVVTLDLPDPTAALDNVNKALKPGGFCISYSPHITQASDLVDSALEKGFLHIKTIELIERNWAVGGRKARPNFDALGHTGFLSLLRKVKGI